MNVCERKFSSFEFMNVEVCVCLVQVWEGAGSQKKAWRVEETEQETRNLAFEVFISTAFRCCSKQVHQEVNHFSPLFGISALPYSCVRLSPEH